MKKYYLLLIFSMISWVTYAQKQAVSADSTLFCGYYVNKEFNIYLDIDFFHNNIEVPGQELFGKLPGYLGDKQDSRKWLFVAAEIKSNKKAMLSVINDYGSEDLKASLTLKNDTTVLLKQEEGSDLKIARNRKWQKLPTQLEFIKSQKP